MPSSDLKPLIAASDVLAPIEVGRAAKFAMLASSQFNTAFEGAAVAAWKGRSGETPGVYLLIEGVPSPKNPSTCLRIFLNCKEPTLSTPIDDPSYVGTVTPFFDRTHHGDSPKASFAIDLRETLSRLYASGGYAPGSGLDVALIPVDLEDPQRATPEETLRPERIQIVTV